MVVLPEIFKYLVSNPLFMDTNIAHPLVDSVSQEFKDFVTDYQQFLNDYHNCEQTLNRSKLFYKRGVALKERYRDLDAHFSLLSIEINANHAEIDTVVKRASIIILDSIRDE